jgi:hypothetical protein
MLSTMINVQEVYRNGIHTKMTLRITSKRITCCHPNIQTRDEIQNLALAMSVLSETVNSSINALHDSEPAA